MENIDEFASNLLEEAKRFLERANETDDHVAEVAYLHAALMIGFCSFEAHVNAIAEEMVLGKGLTPHEVGLLIEKDVRLEGGIFEVRESLKISRMEDKLAFLFARFGNPLDKDENWWGDFKGAIHLRNKLTHPKDVPVISIENVRNALEAIIETTDRVYRVVYKRGFPAAGRGTQSSLSF